MNIHSSLPVSWSTTSKFLTYKHCSFLCQSAGRKLSSIMEFVVSTLTYFLSLSIAKTLTEPLERARVVQQTRPKNFLYPDAEYSGFFHTLIRLFNERPLSCGNSLLIIIIYVYLRGALFNSLRDIPKKGLGSITKKRLKKYVDFVLPISVPKDSLDSPFFQIIVALKKTVIGMLAALVSHIFALPFDFERTNQESDVNYTSESFFGYTRIAIHKHGIWHIYESYWISVIGILPFRGGFVVCKILTTFFLIKLLRKKELSSSTKWAVMQFSFVFGAFLLYPFDTVRRRVMVMGADYHRDYDGVIDCFLVMYQEEGLFSFFDGFMANIIRDFISSLIMAFLSPFLNWCVEKIIWRRVERKKRRKN